MKLYLASIRRGGWCRKNAEIKDLFRGSHKLLSYFYAEGNSADRKWFKWFTMKENKVDLFLDSGAFSAWNSGAQIDLDAYIAFCLEHIDAMGAIANLDVIPGRPFQRLTQKDINDSAERGWENYQKMLVAGIPREKLIHIFHQGEDMRWLKRMVQEMPYIGLSPANDKTTGQKVMWLDQCMNYVTDDDGMPIVKFHGFAVTSLRLMLRYPWYSVDSSAWAIAGRSGAIYVPRYRGGQWIYNESSWKIAVSNRNPGNKEAKKHITTLPPKEQEIILEYIHAQGYQLGRSRFEQMPQSHTLEDNEGWTEKKLEIIEEAGLCNNPYLRDEINISFFQDLEKSMPEWPRPFKGRGMKGFMLT